MSPSTCAQRGSVTLETVILFPVLLTMLFGAVQAGLWFHARNTAITAAQEGARASSAYQSSSGRGEEAARAFAADAGASGIQVNSSRGATTTTVTVTVEAPNLLPWVIPAMPITQSASMPVERIT